MVASNNDLPLIGNGQGVAVAFENEWFRAALDRAASQAGYEAWWLLDEFSSTVSQYLRHDYSAKVIELPKLERVVRATLRDIGYHEIAVRFQAVNPFQNISLAGCLDVSSRTQIGIFFQRLTERIRTLHAVKVRHFHFHDLQFCAGQLEGDDLTLPILAGSPMHVRIVDFIRETVGTLSWQREVLCTIR